MVTTFKQIRLYSMYRLKTASNPDQYTEYNEDSLHKPVFKSPTTYFSYAPEPYAGDLRYNFSDVTPRKGEELSVVELPIDHSDFEGIVKLASAAPTFVLIDVGNAITERTMIAGWIDRTEPVATKGPNMNTRIYWHVDYYLTSEYMRFESERMAIGGISGYDIRFSYGHGIVKRGPESMKRPDPSSPRRWVQSAAKNLMASETTQKIPWVIVAFTVTNGGNTTLSYINWQPGVSITSGGQTYSTLSWDDVYGGYIEERLGLDPNAVIGAWLAPMPASLSSVYIHGTYAAYQYFNSGSTVTLTGDMGSDVATSDLVKYVFIDNTGTEMFTAPWGLPFEYIIEQIDVGSSGANVQIYLADKAEYTAVSADVSKLAKAAEGRLFSFPLPAVPVTENAWASYNYSGERAYDIQMREIQRNQNAINGISGIGTSIIGGAIAGSIAPGVGTVAGAAAGAVSGILGTGLNYASSGYFDAKSQESVDKLTASQTAAMIVTARGRRGMEPIGKYDESFGWGIITMEADSVSAAELSDDQTERGYITDAWVSDCSTLIAQGGPLRIEGLEIKGSVPLEFKQYLTALFARGVHLDILT